MEKEPKGCHGPCWSWGLRPQSFHATRASAWLSLHPTQSTPPGGPGRGCGEEGSLLPQQRPRGPWRRRHHRLDELIASSHAGRPWDLTVSSSPTDAPNWGPQPLEAAQPPPSSQHMTKPGWAAENGALKCPRVEPSILGKGGTRREGTAWVPQLAVWAGCARDLCCWRPQGGAGAKVMARGQAGSWGSMVAL